VKTVNATPRCCDISASVSLLKLNYILLLIIDFIYELIIFITFTSLPVANQRRVSYSVKGATVNIYGE